jgi:hypothetical protein
MMASAAQASMITRLDAIAASQLSGAARKTAMWMAMRSSGDSSGEDGVRVEARQRLRRAEPHLCALVAGVRPSGAARRARNAALHTASDGSRLGWHAQASGDSLGLTQQGGTGQDGEGHHQLRSEEDGHHQLRSEATGRSCSLCSTLGQWAYAAVLASELWATHSGECVVDEASVGGGAAGLGEGDVAAGTGDAAAGRVDHDSAESLGTACTRTDEEVGVATRTSSSHPQGPGTTHLASLGPPGESLQSARQSEEGILGIGAWARVGVVARIAAVEAATFQAGERPHQLHGVVAISAGARVGVATRTCTSHPQGLGTPHLASLGIPGESMQSARRREGGYSGAQACELGSTTVGEGAGVATRIGSAQRVGSACLPEETAISACFRAVTASRTGPAPQLRGVVVVGASGGVGGTTRTGPARHQDTACLDGPDRESMVASEALRRKVRREIAEAGVAAARRFGAMYPEDIERLARIHWSVNGLTGQAMPAISATAQALETTGGTV